MYQSTQQRTHVFECMTLSHWNQVLQKSLAYNKKHNTHKNVKSTTVNDKVSAKYKTNSSAKNLNKKTPLWDHTKQTKISRPNKTKWRLLHLKDKLCDSLTTPELAPAVWPVCCCRLQGLVSWEPSSLIVGPQSRKTFLQGRSPLSHLALSVSSQKTVLWLVH